MQIIQNYYSKIKNTFLDDSGYKVPERYRSSFIHAGGGCEVQGIYNNFIKNKNIIDILMIGVMGGRDYYYFKNKGYRITSIDLGEQEDFQYIYC